MTPENPTTEPVRSNWNPQNTPGKPGKPGEPGMEAFMGPSRFEHHDDEYLEPGEMAPTDEMDAMMDHYLDQMGTDINTGQLLTVPVVAVKSDGVLVDIGDKSEGFIPLREFPVIDNVPQIKIGDIIEVVVKGNDPETGLVNLSYREARRRKSWELAETAFKERKSIKGVVSRTVKGGLILDIGTTAFLPASQIDLRRVEDFDAWIGREVEGYVIEFTPEKRRIIVSRRQLLEEQREAQRREIVEKITPGQTIEVTVKRIVDFGAFVELGGIDGLIPRSEISWQRNARPEDYIKQGETLTAKVVEIDAATGKVTLSRRQAMQNPWDSVHERFPVGTRVNGSVVSVTNYGAFVRIEEGLDGMIHISDMAWDAAGKRPADYLAAAQEVDAQVLNIDVENHRISLGLKQLTRDPWDDLEERYPKGTRVKGAVSGMTKFGAFVELEPGIEGMIHVSDFSWEKRIAQPRDMVKKGDEIECVVLEISREKRRISLGVKQLSESPRERVRRTFSNGDVIEGDVTRVTEFGAFVNMGGQIEGFIHISQLDPERVNRTEDVIKVGDHVTAKITKIDPETGKISLSRKQMMKDAERKTVQQYMKAQSGNALNSLGSLLSEIHLEDDLPAVPAAPSKFPENPQGKALEVQQPDPTPEQTSGTPDEPAPASPLPVSETDAEPKPAVPERELE